jgi:hypothetical protein
MSIYNAVVKQGKWGAPAFLVQTSWYPVTPVQRLITPIVTRLNAIRDEQSQAQSSLATNAASSSNTPNSGPAPPEPNRVDTVLGDVFALLSLFFLTIGKSRETPAIYCQIASMRVSRVACLPFVDTRDDSLTPPQQILSHMNESGAYTEAFLLPYRERLESLKQILRQDSAEGKHPEPIVRLMMRKLEGVGEYPERTSHLSRQWANPFAPLRHLGRTRPDPQEARRTAETARVDVGGTETQQARVQGDHGGSPQD